MPYGHSPSSRYRWRADREPDAFYSGPFSRAMGNRSDEMLSIGLLEIAVLCWPVTLGLLAISGFGFGLGHLFSRAEARGRARALAAALLAALPRPTLRALDDELHRRLGLVRRHRGPRRRSA